MKQGNFRTICAVSALTLIAAFAMPQDPLNKKKGGGGGGTGGGKSGGGTPPARNEPPPQRNQGGGGGSPDRDRGNRGGGSSGGSQNRGSGGSTGGGTIFGSGGQDRRNTGNSGGQVSGGRIFDSRGQDPLNRRQQPSRSGTVQYGTVFNSRVHGNQGPVTIGRAPNGFGGLIERKVNQQERIGLVWNGYRSGYYHYDRRWRDDYFCYPHYVFDPFAYNRIAYSPWYYYPSCPPYLNYNRVIIIGSLPVYNWSTWHDYRWSRPDRWERYDSQRDLDYAIQDIVSAYQDGDYRAITRLVPRRGNVNIYVDGRYNYSLNQDDFYDLLMDGIENVYTRRYEIMSVRTDGRDRARIEARHEFEDPWGRRQTVYHFYLLESDRGNFVIREFGTSNYRSW